MKDYFNFRNDKFNYLKLLSNIKLINEIYDIEHDDIENDKVDKVDNDYNDTEWIIDELDFSDSEYDATKN